MISCFFRTSRLLLLALLMSVGLVACGGDDKGKRPAAAHLVELSEAVEDNLSYRVERNGSLRAIRSVKLFNQEEGRVLVVNVREGDSVKKDQLLAKLDDRLLRAQVDKALASRKQARQDVRRFKQLKDKQLIAEETVTRALNALDIAKADVRLLRTRLSYITIKAPFDGKIAERKAEPGDVAPKHTHLLTIIDPSKLITDVQVSELALPYMKVGDVADVRIDALGQQIFPGKILRIYPTVDAATRLGRIEVALSPVPQGARPGQFCRVTLSTSEHKRLTVPFAALRRDSAGEHVFLYGDDGKVIRQAVKSGLRLTDKVEIRDGLYVGQRVVSKGFLGLSEGKAVKSVAMPDANGAEKKPVTKQPKTVEQTGA